MICPKCGATIEDGFLYCKTCGEEITIVPEFNPVTDTVSLENEISDSVNSIIDDIKDGQKTAAEETQEIDIKEKDSKKIEKNTGFRRSKTSSESDHHNLASIVLMLILIIAILAAGLMYFRKYEHDHSYEYQYGLAAKYYEEKNYEKALTYVENAKNISSELSIWKLQANIAMDMKDYDSAENCYHYILDNLDPSNQETYMKLINLAIERNDLPKVKDLLANTTIEGVRDYYADYITVVPTASLPDGEYYDSISIELNAENADIYYTLDGSTPTANSLHYVSPILLTEGTTTIRAISVSPKGIVSAEAIFKYEISYLEADPPVVSPQSGDYAPGFQIVVQVPDGCTVLYTVDGREPTLDSMVYEKPITVNEDMIFKAISVSMSERESDVITRSYHVIQ